jgi:hypothetical protein
MNGGACDSVEDDDEASFSCGCVKGYIGNMCEFESTVSNEVSLTMELGQNCNIALARKAAQDGNYIHCVRAEVCVRVKQGKGVCCRI